MCVCVWRERRERESARGAAARCGGVCSAFVVCGVPRAPRAPRASEQRDVVWGVRESVCVCGESDASSERERERECVCACVRVPPGSSKLNSRLFKTFLIPFQMKFNANFVPIPKEV